MNSDDIVPRTSLKSSDKHEESYTGLEKPFVRLQIQDVYNEGYSGIDPVY